MAESNVSSTVEALLQRLHPQSSLGDLSRVLEAEVIPRLHRPSVQTEHKAQSTHRVQSTHTIKKRPAATVQKTRAHGAPSAGVTERDIAALADGLLKQDLHNAWSLVQKKHDAGMDAEQIAVELLGPAARHLGELWVADRCSFTDVTLGTGYLHQFLRDLTTRLNHAAETPGYHHRILLLPAPGEQHIFGLSILGESFRRRGWDVCGGPAQDRNAMLQMLGREHFDVIGFSVSADRWIDGLSLEIERCRQRSRNPGLLVMVGGHAIDAQPGLVAQLGADLSVSDARLAPDTVLARLEEPHADSC